MSKFDSHKWTREFKEAWADSLNEKDEKVTLKDLLHTVKVDDKKADKVDIKIGAENDLAIEKDKDGNDVYAGGLKEDVDYSNMRLQSNIDQKWHDSEDMTKDLRQWVEASMQSGGYDLLDDIVSALEVEVRLYKIYRNKMQR
jgi:hypothetical protein